MASIAFVISGVLWKPFSLSSVAFTSTITRIVCLLVRPASSTWHRNDEQRLPAPTSPAI
jgi:hypothetical protein